MTNRHCGNFLATSTQLSLAFVKARGSSSICTSMNRHCGNLLGTSTQLARILYLIVYEICLKLKSGNRIIRIFPTLISIRMHIGVFKLRHGLTMQLHGMKSKCFLEAMLSFLFFSFFCPRLALSTLNREDSNAGRE